MNARIVRPFAERAFAALAPYCERIEIAGGLRREATDVKDVDIVCIPRSRLMIEFDRTVNQWRPVKGKSSGKYTQRVLDAAHGLKLDVFMCQPAAWACNMLIRTGSEEFSKSVVSYARHIDREFDDLHLRVMSTGAAIPVLEEADVFDELGLPWIAPANRTGRLEDILGRAFFRR